MGFFDFFKSNKNIDDDNGKNETYYNDKNAFYKKGKGKLRESFYRKDGILNGLYTELFSNSTLKQIGEYKNGKKEGKWLYNGVSGLTDYITTRSRRWVVTYKNGLLHGRFRVYQLFMVEPFQLEYLEKNHLKYPEFWKYHKHYHKDLVSIQDHYIEFLVEEGNCVNGIKDGEWKIYEPETIQAGRESNVLTDLGVLPEDDDTDYLPTGKIKRTYSTVWKDGNIEKGGDSDDPYSFELKRNIKSSCYKSKTPLIYINTFKDNNGIKIIDCYGNTVDYDDCRWKLESSFIDRDS